MFFFILLTERKEKMEERKMLEGTFAILDRHLMVKMPRELDHHNAGRIRERADYFLLMDNVDNIVFDFEDTMFMDSSGIGVIMGRYKKVCCFGGKVYAIHTNERIKKIIQMSGLQNIVEIIS